jgi:hypothetical protein
LNRWNKILFSTSLLLAVSCSKSSTTTNAPSPTSPSTTTTTITTQSTTNPNLAALANAAAIDLTDNVNYTGLEAFAGVVNPPLVSDPVILMTLPDDRSTTFSSTLNIEFEDRIGAWEGTWTSFPETATRTSTSVDAIFSDSHITVRVVAAIESDGDTMDGIIYYRLRQTGDTYCEQEVCASGNCPAPPDPAPACIAAMSNPSTTPQIVELGTFVGSYSAWATTN